MDSQVPILGVKESSSHSSKVGLRHFHIFLYLCLMRLFLKMIPILHSNQKTFIYFQKQEVQI